MVMMRPLTRPNPAPRPSPTVTASGADNPLCSRSAVTTVHKAKTAPTERSIPAVRMT